jgi:DNA-binding CsgD family transcriptional regulator
MGELFVKADSTQRIKPRSCPQMLNVTAGAVTREIQRVYLFQASRSNGFRGLARLCGPRIVSGPLHNTSESTSVATELISRDSSPYPLLQMLTAREIMVAQMVSQGLPNKKIASHLSITVGTTKTHLHHIYQKLNCTGRVNLAIYMQKTNGL